MPRDSEDIESSTESCFSGILRRILCTGSLPTHPSNSDFVPEFDSNLEKKNVPVRGQGTPGVVARLMGLESLPDIKWLPKDAINFRSRSVRSADYFPQFDHLSQDSQHRRVRTSVSFREVPTFSHEDLFLVRFDKRDDSNAMGSQDTKNVKTSSKSVGRNVKGRAVVKKEKTQNKKRNLEPKRSSYEARNLLPYYNKSNEVYIRSSPRIKKKRLTKRPNSSCEEVCSGMKHARMREHTRTATHARTESSSTTASSSESLATTSGTSRKLGLNLNYDMYSILKSENVEYPCPSYSPERSNARDNDQEVTRGNQIRKSDSLMKGKEIEFYIRNFAEVCRLNEEDTKICHELWIKFDDSEDICLELERYILNMLLQQVVDELC